MFNNNWVLKHKNTITVRAKSQSTGTRKLNNADIGNPFPFCHSILDFQTLLHPLRKNVRMMICWFRDHAAYGAACVTIGHSATLYA